MSRSAQAAMPILLFLLLPIAIVFPVSLIDQRYLSLPQHAVSFQHYRSLLTSEAWQSSIATSALVATVSAALATLCGALCAIGCWRIGTAWAKAVAALTLIPLIVLTIV